MKSQFPFPISSVPPPREKEEKGDGLFIVVKSNGPQGINVWLG